MVLLSVRAGLRAKEVAFLNWSMVTDAEGQVIDAIHLINKASKGRNGGQELAGHASLSTHPALCPGPQRRQGPRHGPDLTVG